MTNYGYHLLTYQHSLNDYFRAIPDLHSDMATDC